MATQELVRILRPQRQIDLIVSVDFVRERIDVRATVIYDSDQSQKRLVIAQTNPPILKSMVGRRVEATMLIREDQEGPQKRIGYQTKILEFMSEYQLREGAPEQAVAIGYPAGPLKDTSVRLHYRVQPSRAHQVSVSISGETERVNLLDLSLGGLLISYDGRTEYRPGQRISLILTIKETPIPIIGEAIRIFDREGSKLIFVGIKFTEIETQAAKLIQETVSEIMREDLKSRSGLTGGGGR